MAIEPRRIHANPETELSDVLAQATKAPVLVEKDGLVYRVSPEPEDLAVGYDPAAVRQVLKTYANLLTPEEADERIAEIYRAREEGSRPADRP